MDDLSHGFVFMFSSYLTFLQNIRIELVTECILIYSLVSNKIFSIFVCEFLDRSLYKLHHVSLVPTNIEFFLFFESLTCESTNCKLWSVDFMNSF
jgi:hypothetical protein